MTHRSVPAPFLTKTYLLVDDPATDDIISWNGDGTTFVVWKTADFARDLLPNSFKHNNFSSFVHKKGRNDEKALQLTRKLMIVRKNDPQRIKI
ncbi:Heat shock factor (HSF)-type, DNA-binding [Artemisia annua]|uniref:Heat shock factor (HSF)-type, DNA-binding n=1 Tax=Artemisia annua TaxID=35608 RepID=A0A2U1MTP9_ARTAN|nr:Heat shock factor (HSF)-type, DNA-binding [Artemisia annua]